MEYLFSDLSAMVAVLNVLKEMGAVGVKDVGNTIGSRNRNIRKYFFSLGAQLNVM
jgi:hypothetical protein